MKTRLMKRYLDLLDKYEAADQIAQQLARVTAERDKLRENGTDIQRTNAVRLVAALGYRWMEGTGWVIVKTDPKPDLPVATELASAPSAPVHPEKLAWPKQATHYLYNPKAMGEQYYFAEFHEGDYYHLPTGQSDPRDWEWNRRGSMTVGADAWQVVKVRK